MPPRDLDPRYLIEQGVFIGCAFSLLVLYGTTAWCEFEARTRAAAKQRRVPLLVFAFNRLGGLATLLLCCVSIDQRAQLGVFSAPVVLLIGGLATQFMFAGVLVYMHLLVAAAANLRGGSRLLALRPWRTLLRVVWTLNFVGSLLRSGAVLATNETRFDAYYTLGFGVLTFLTALSFFYIGFIVISRLKRHLQAVSTSVNERSSMHDSGRRLKVLMVVIAVVVAASNRSQVQYFIDEHNNRAPMDFGTRDSYSIDKSIFFWQVMAVLIIMWLLMFRVAFRIRSPKGDERSTGEEDTSSTRKPGLESRDSGVQNADLEPDAAQEEEEPSATQPATSV